MGPRVHDMALKDIVDVILKVNAGAYSFEAANPRHDHEWRVWEDVKLPEGALLIPGVITQSTVLVEHPELVADRIERFASRGRARERHRRRRLRLRDVRRLDRDPSLRRVGQAAGAGRRRADRVEAAVGARGLRGTTASAPPEPGLDQRSAMLPTATPPRIRTIAATSASVSGSPSHSVATIVLSTGVASRPSEVVTAGRLRLARAVAQ